MSAPPSACRQTAQRSIRRLLLQASITASLVLTALLAVVLAPAQARAAGASEVWPMCAGLPATIIGTAGADTLVGTPGPDVIVGLGGADSIDGRGGPDWICGGDGGDRLRGGTGGDNLDGQAGDDLLYGESGNDVLRGDAGSDRLSGGAGHDDLRGGTGRNTNAGGDGRDLCHLPHTTQGASTCEPICRVQRHAGTRVAEIALNSIETQQSTPGCFVESDFVLTLDGHLVAAHDDLLSGDCGRASQRTLAQLRTCRLVRGQRVASLADFLAVPLTEWYLDLKSTLAGQTPANVLQSVEYAIRMIKATGRTGGAVVMVYQAPPAVVSLLRANGIRAGMKGYPKDQAAATSLVKTAHANAFEMVCINIVFMNKQLLDLSRSISVWHLAWDTGQRTPEQWRALAQVGLTGLLVNRTRLPSARQAMAV
jgi:hypothetical protein